MAVTATFRTTAGTKTWEVSPRKVLDIDGLSTGFELEADNNSAVEGSPLTNERGLKKKQISFSSNFHAALGFESLKGGEAYDAALKALTDKYNEIGRERFPDDPYVNKGEGGGGNG